MEHYSVTGMSCAACSAHVEKAVSAVSGVESVSVSLLTNSMAVEGSADSAAVIAAVQRAGYGAALKGAADKSRASGTTDASDGLEDRETPVLIRRLAVSLVFWLPLMYVSMGHVMWGWRVPAPIAESPLVTGLTELLLTVIIMVVNRKFFVNGFGSLARRSPNMDTLVALGAGAAFVYSTYALFAMAHAADVGNHAAEHMYMHEFYFESAATILALITVGKMLEARSKGKTTDALKGLMRLAPKLATVVRDGAEISVPVEEVKKGDIFTVRPGESIPVDGVVLEGFGAVDESALTGESIPVDKQEGASVSAATINRSGFLRCEATRVGEDTTLSQIIRMVSDAAATKAPIAKAADKVSGIFVPAVMGIAAVTVAVWLLAGGGIGTALGRGIAVLVISCPCALGLATPVAIMVGSGVGARGGILFKTAAALEAAGRTKIVVLDKTGTITRGEPVVTDIIASDGVTRSELLSLAYALEVKSEHPLAGAVVGYCKENSAELSESAEFTAHSGSGVSAVIDGASAQGGNYSFISGFAKIGKEMLERAESLADEGKTPLYFARGGTLYGIIAVSDVIKEDSPEAIRRMKDIGLRVVMLTGDNEKTAKTVGAQAGVDEVIAGVLPDGKEEVVRGLLSEGKVAMVGDGINDAPALTRADLGIAIGAGADIALDAADVVLMKSSLSDVPAAVHLGKKVLKNIHENLFWAFIYNIIGIPIAAGVFYPLLGWKLNPMFGAAAMSLSSFCVVTNALRLNFVRLHGRNTNKNTESEKEDSMKKTIEVTGMMCAHCEMRVKKALEELPQVKTASADHEKNTAEVELEGEIDDGALKSAIEKEGYTVGEIR
ncbi:MAG: heavy metal translocating P-type ATPase [Butyrivibrio sp.]|nr:heavy metal translocating P-type ATPase [Butyrivibrio sp.]